VRRINFVFLNVGLAEIDFFLDFNQAKQGKVYICHLLVRQLFRQNSFWASNHDRFELPVISIKANYQKEPWLKAWL